ncbi:uncharacterized protein LOC126738245 [Anthonomus grandis grandis]|uniref:uncharacterized protein LOC126738245 n=1 Tax=Anthonomus grandis grandis TaxID=2921223 RepID=UPI0021668999|nr:uncharacterized protein LOC126738245 [Anthonomus grandis grandis]
MVIKSTTYTGMNLKGEIRESISLDEDDISDVEDEVFIRDGKNGYKFAEELNVKRPLMAPRRKHGKHDLGTRLKPRPPCRAWCKPCCYVLIALSILIGLIILVVVLVSIYPLPLDKLRDWIISKEKKVDKSDRYLPCTNLRVTDVWAVNFPGLTTDSPVRTLDINKDGIEDVVFGYGVGENYNIFPPDIFCSIYLGVLPPCAGGILAMNGKDGTILWQLWLNDTIFSLHCTADVNLDGTEDCLAIGVDGTLGVFDSKTGNQIWKLNTGKTNVFVANFIHDQDGDNISDVITSHSSLEDKTSGHIMLLSGKTGQELKRANIPNKSKTFFMPQVYKQNENSTILLFGSGTPNTPGNLSYVQLSQLSNLENTSRTIYEDKSKGILTQSVLVDITGDEILDIVSSVYNSTIIAINGKTFKTIWNYTVENAVTDMSPTPALFNSDNITDFLVVYQKYDNIFNYNYTETLIIDGLTGKPIYPPINGGIITQMNGLTLSMEGEGHDIYLLWTSECAHMDQSSNSNSNKKQSEDQPKVYDECKKQFNTSTILKLNGLNEYHQPPGITIYNSAFKSDFEHSNIKSVTKILKEYLQTHPNPNLNYKELEGESEVYENYNAPHGHISRKYGKSSFRHKDKPNGILKEFDVPEASSNGMGVDRAPIPEEVRMSEQSPSDYKSWMGGQDYIDPEFSNYNLGDDNIPYNQKQMLYDEVAPKINPGNRDPRSKEKGTLNLKDPAPNPKSQKKNLSDKIYGYHNIRLAKNRLLRDEESLPTDILKETYFKNEENRLRKTKLEQRDVNSHVVGEMDDSDIKMILDEQKRDALQNHSTTLWDIETESELVEREDRGYIRRKRDLSTEVWESVNKVTSVGAVLESFNVSNTSDTIDVLFVKYWHPSEISLETIMARDIEECVQEKIQQFAKPSTVLTHDQKVLYEKQCQEEQDNLRGDFIYFNQLASLRFGQMTVYRIRIQCDCDSTFDKKIKEKCAKFLPKRLQTWPQYLGRNGDGIFGR